MTIKDQVGINKTISRFASESSVVYSEYGDFVPAVCCGEDADTLYLWEHMNFHRSWDWLTPVVEKIRTIGPHYDVTTSRHCVFLKLGENECRQYHIDRYKTIKECTLLAVLEFIHHYNTRIACTEEPLAWDDPNLAEMFQILP